MNATDGSIVGGVQLLVPSFMNGQFESSSGALVGIVMTDTQIFVKRISLTTGEPTTVVSLDTQWMYDYLNCLHHCPLPSPRCMCSDACVTDWL